MRFERRGDEERDHLRISPGKSGNQSSATDDCTRSRFFSPVFRARALLACSFRYRERPRIQRLFQVVNHPVFASEANRVCKTQRDAHVFARVTDLREPASNLVQRDHAVPLFTGRNRRDDREILRYLARNRDEPVPVTIGAHRHAFCGKNDMIY